MRLYRVPKKTFQGLLAGLVIPKGSHGASIETKTAMRFYGFFIHKHLKASFTCLLIKKPSTSVLGLLLQRGRDSNPRNVSVYTLSRRAPSTTRPPLYLFLKRIFRLSFSLRPEGTNLSNLQEFQQ